MPLKEKIATNFSLSATSYEQYAVMQQQAALSIVRRLLELRHEIAVGPILEVGCGTGAVSRELLTMFPDRRLTLVDLAPGMIAENRESLAAHLEPDHQVDWQVQDAETIDRQKHYALIVSCLALQWFQDVIGTLTRLSAALIPEGILLCSYLGDSSFPEWRRACELLDLPCTINKLPNSQTLGQTLQDLGYEVTAWTETIAQDYPTTREFFRSLKKTGTNTQAAAVGLTVSQLSRLLAGWPKNKNGSVTVTYQINSILVRS